MCEPGQWIDSTRCINLANRLAPVKALRTYSDDRPLEVRIDDWWVGLHGEITYACENDLFEWWAKREKALANACDDGGEDFPGVGVKTIRLGSNCVRIAPRVDGRYPDVYVVYELDVARRLIRFLGQCRQCDVGTIDFG